MAMAMATSNHPPERHFGYVCCKCQAADFLGRRYACWLCADYQLCGSCYDSGQLPLQPQHTYLHPLNAYYTRAEYELYFGGEPYLADNVPQSYKCAMCDELGFNSMQLYKHLSDVHRNHKDFDEYFSILYSHNAVDALNIQVASTSLRTVSSLPRPVASQRSSLEYHPVSFEELRMRNARKVVRLEQQVFNMLEDVRLSSSRQSESVMEERCMLDPARGILDPEDAWASFFSLRDVQRNQDARIERLATNFADPVRNIPNETDALDKEKDEDKDTATNKQSDSHKFLCDQFMIPQPAPNAERQCQQIPSVLDRKRFVEAILCSMLADEHLGPVELKQPVVLTDEHLKPVKLEAPAVQVEPNFGNVSSERKPEEDLI